MLPQVVVASPEKSSSDQNAARCRKEQPPEDLVRKLPSHVSLRCCCNLQATFLFDGTLHRDSVEHCQVQKVPFTLNLNTVKGWFLACGASSKSMRSWYVLTRCDFPTPKNANLRPRQSQKLQSSGDWLVIQCTNEVGISLNDEGNHCKTEAPVLGHLQ